MSSVPSDAKEILIEVTNSNTSYGAYVLSDVIKTTTITITGRILARGHYRSSSDYAAIKVSLSISDCHIGVYDVNGASYLNTAIIKVYYR